MKLAKFRWRRLGAALALGLLLEVFLLVAMVAGVNMLPKQFGDMAGDWLQLPGSYLVTILAKVYHPGFEEQAGYVLLVPLIQWLTYSIVIYILLVRRASRHPTVPMSGICSRTASPK